MCRKLLVWENWRGSEQTSLLWLVCYKPQQQASMETHQWDFRFQFDSEQWGTWSAFIFCLNVDLAEMLQHVLALLSVAAMKANSWPGLLYRCVSGCVYLCTCDCFYHLCRWTLHSTALSSFPDVVECLLPAAVTDSVSGYANTPGSFHCLCPADHSLQIADSLCQGCRTFAWYNLLNWLTILLLLWALLKYCFSPKFKANTNISTDFMHADFRL